MLRQLRPVAMGFVASAPLRHVFWAEIEAPPSAVYRAFAEEPEEWPEWFVPLVAVVRTREGYQVRLRSGGQFWETVLAAEPGERYAVREEWQMSPAGTGTRLRWTIATDGSVVYRAAARMTGFGFARTFQKSMRLLEKRLTRPSTA
jgi:hypothetical protein